MKLSHIAIAAVLLASATAGAWYYFAKHRPIEAAKDAVRTSLKDPASAIFGDIKVNGDTGAACGLVNAKNSMGGYVGLRGFLLSKDGSVEFEPSGEAIGDTSAKIAALQKQLDFVERSMKECGIESQAEKKS